MRDPEIPSPIINLNGTDINLLQVIMVGPASKTSGDYVVHMRDHSLNVYGTESTEADESRESVGGYPLAKMPREEFVAAWKAALQPR